MARHAAPVDAVEQADEMMPWIEALADVFDDVIPQGVHAETNMLIVAGQAIDADMDDLLKGLHEPHTVTPRQLAHHVLYAILHKRNCQ